MQEEEYIIINKTQILKRIDELENDIQYYKANFHNAALHEVAKVKLELEQILSQSTPLIPELEKVYDVGRSSFNSALSYEECKEDYYDYISNLKLDI